MDNYDELISLLNNNGKKMVNNLDFYEGKSIPEKKLKNALSSFAKDVDCENVIGFIDTTVMKSGKEGILFTNSGVYIKESFEKTKSIKYSEIKDINITRKSKPKDCDRYIEIENINNISIEITTSLINKTPLYDFLNGAKHLSYLGKTNKTDKFLILEDMDDYVKENYLKIISGYCKINNGVDDIKLAKIYSLMTRIKVSVNIRQNIISFISDEKSIDISRLLENMDSKVPKSTLEVIHLSLIKDMLVTGGTKLKNLTLDQKYFIDIIANKYNISSQKIQFMEESSEADEKLLSGKISDNEYKKIMGDLAAKASAIGVPIAAIYLSGSVVGLSAAGITSGLAALGLGGILGLSSMVTGIGVVVILGVATYSGIKWISNKDKKDKENKREFLMQEAIKLNQGTINNLIEDINRLTEQLIDVISKNEENRVAIMRLNKKLVLFSAALKQSMNRGDDIERGIVAC